MAALAEKQDVLLGRISRSQRPMAIAGGVLALLGAAYLVWGVMRFDPRGDPRQNPGFDWPVARLAFIFERGHAILDNAEPGGSLTEQRLRRGLERNMQFSAGAMLMLLRVFFGTLALVSGFAIVTVVVERARLIALITRLRE
jgi:hypothetical protein